jgi:hypothetical protein
LKHHRFLAAALAALIAAATFALSASAESGSNPKADIQAGNGFCGADVGTLPVVGFTNYHRTGNTVSIEYHLKNALPNATYIVQLWGNACSYLGTVTTITTNKSGVANGNGSLTVPATSTRFFATAWGPNGWNDTPAVTLAP